MPFIIAFLGAVIVPLIPSIIRGLVTYAAVALGFSLVTYVGASVAIDTLVDYIQANMDGLGSDVAQLLSLAGADKFINIVLTCGVFGFTLKGLMSASGYKASWRKPQNIS